MKHKAPGFLLMFILLPSCAENTIIEQISGNGTFEPIGSIPEIRFYDYPKLHIGGTKNQVLVAAEIDKFIDNICLNYYYLFIAKLDSVK